MLRGSRWEAKELDFPELSSRVATWAGFKKRYLQKIRFGEPRPLAASYPGLCGDGALRRDHCMGWIDFALYPTLVECP